MTRSEYINNAYTIMENSFGEKRNEWIDSKPGQRGNIYCSFVSFVENYLHEYKYYNSYIDEIDEIEVGREFLSYSDALYTILKIETGLCLKKDICKEIIKYLNENKNNIEIIIYKEN